MGSHVRTQIRNALATALANLPTTGSRVYPSRVYAITENDLPCLTIAMVSEKSVIVTNVDLVERQLQFTVDAYAKATTSVDDTLDQICLEVEVALAIPCLALRGLSQSIELIQTLISLDGATDQLKGRAAMTFELTYFTQQNAPDVAH